MVVEECSVARWCWYVWVREEWSDRVVLDGEAYDSGTVATDFRLLWLLLWRVHVAFAEGEYRGVCWMWILKWGRCGLHKG